MPQPTDMVQTLLGQVIVKELQERKSIILEKDNTLKEDMYLLVKQLHAGGKRLQSCTLKEWFDKSLYILGDSVLGSPST